LCLKIGEKKLVVNLKRKNDIPVYKCPTTTYSDHKIVSKCRYIRESPVGGIEEFCRRKLYFAFLRYEVTGVSCHEGSGE
jgi:hypothetical protein